MIFREKTCQLIQLAWRLQLFLNLTINPKEYWLIDEKVIYLITHFYLPCHIYHPFHVFCPSFFLSFLPNGVKKRKKKTSIDNLVQMCCNTRKNQQTRFTKRTTKLLHHSHHYRQSFLQKAFGVCQSYWNWLKGKETQEISFLFRLK